MLISREGHVAQDRPVFHHLNRFVLESAVGWAVYPDLIEKKTDRERKKGGKKERKSDAVTKSGNEELHGDRTPC